MEQQIKYQYTYFIYPYIIEPNKYNKYMLKLIRNPKCKLKTFDRIKDFDIYTYFLPNIIFLNSLKPDSLKFISKPLDHLNF